MRTYLGEQTITIVTDEAIYTLNTTVVSLIVSSKAEFNKIKTEFYKGSATSAVSNLRDGYFILDDDVDFGGEAFMMFDSVTLTNPAGGNWDAWGDATPYYGWSGVIDGRGYAIYNFTLLDSTANTAGGLIGRLGSKGVIKNIAFIDAAIYAKAGAVVGQNYGLVENVFVSGEIFGDTNATNPKGLINAKNCGIIRNSITLITSDSIPDYTAGVAGAEYTGSSIQNCYSIGAGNAVYEPTKTGYADIDAFAAASLNLSSFDEDLWIFVLEGETKSISFGGKIVVS